ncbi:hypothetical protein [Pseudomonas sp. 8Z]|uniref:hypothetical protein n=1 Tax=Pseudomonas sp. 8Z TaxID=2653166 RepID=UPI0021141E97|nr:hypothetical protein [Pseudomonas sp. 8Z]
MRKSFVLLLCLSWLSGCERAEAPAAQVSASVKTPVVARVTAPEPAPVAKIVEQAPSTQAVVSRPPEPAKAPVAASIKPAEVAPPQSLEREVQRALDLSVPQALFEQAVKGETEQELSPLLPPLFAEKPEGVSPVQISGRLINNAQVDDYWESIEGAEVQFEFKQ